MKEVKELQKKVLAKGEKLPDEKAFDSNCIMPGMSLFQNPLCPASRLGPSDAPGFLGMQEAWR